MAEPLCPLCGAHSELFYAHRKKSFFQCSRCDGIFLDPAMRLSETEEKNRYLHHQNDAHDPGYRAYLAPLTDFILRNYMPEAACLDFGCGPDSAVAKVLQEHGFKPFLYDPFFYPEAHLLQQTYDVIACSEVMEHFYNPLNEFVLLRRMLNPGGKLCCMTRLVLPETDFAGWFYKNDATHVFFYAPATLDYICRKAGFKSLEVRDRLIVFKA